MWGGANPIINGGVSVLPLIDDNCMSVLIPVFFFMKMIGSLVGEALVFSS